MNNIKTLKPHISLNVKNVEASIEFYQKLFDIEPAKVRTGYAKFDAQNPLLNLALNEAAYLIMSAARFRISESRLLRPKTF